MMFALYLVYAYVQGVLAARLMRATDFGTVAVCMLFAPIVTVIMVGAAFVMLTELMLRRGK